VAEARDRYFAAALGALRKLAEAELAFAEFEAVAKLIEVHFDNTPFEPHHLTDAKKYMLSSGELVAETDSTRGGRDVALYRTAFDLGRSKAIDEAAARKRLLLARYYGFTEGSASAGEGLTGVAGEVAVHGAIMRAGVGTSMAKTYRDRPSASALFGVPIPGGLGPLDNAILLQPLTRELLPREPYGVVIPIEVKNIREWVYPHTKELYQLLHKSVLLQREMPERPFVPVLICRRLHKTTTFMAKAIGFFAIDSRKHYFPVHSRIEGEKLKELRVELGLTDITQNITDTRRLENALRVLQTKYDVQLASDRWRELSLDDEFLDVIEHLHRLDNPGRRSDEMQRLRELVAEFGRPAGW
jgi:hypothetical protein